MRQETFYGIGSAVYMLLHLPVALMLGVSFGQWLLLAFIVALSYALYLKGAGRWLINLAKTV